MQAANKASPSTLEVLKWLREQRRTISFEDVQIAKEGTLFLAIYGKLTVRKLNHLRGPLEAKEKAIEELIARELKRLISGSSYPKSAYEVENPRFKHIQVLIADFAPRPYAIQEARTYKLFRIPNLDGEPLAIEPYFQNLEVMLNVAATYLIQFFSEHGLESEAEIPINLWMEYSLILLRYEALPGCSYLDALVLWRKEQSQKYGEEATACKLFTEWKALSPFFSIITEGKTDLPRFGEVVRLPRRAGGMQIREEDTFEAFLVRSSTQCLLTLMNSVVQRKINDLKEEPFKFYFESKCHMLLLNGRLRPYIHYFILTISRCYSKPAEIREPQALVKHLYNTLKRLLYVEKVESGNRKKQLPQENQEAFSLLSTILLFYHTTLSSPSYLPLNFSWFKSLYENRHREALIGMNFQINLEESMQSLSVSHPEETVLKWIRKSIEKKVPGANLGEVIAVYQRRCAPHFKDEAAKLYAFYFIQLLTMQQTGKSLLALETFLTHHISPHIGRDLQSMLLGLMLFHYTVLLAPENVKPQLDLFEYFLNLEHEQKLAKLDTWKRFEIKSDNESLLDIGNLNALFTTVAKTPVERAELLTAVTADHLGLRPRGAPVCFKATLRFIERLQQMCQFKISDTMAHFVLTSHAVVPEIAKYIEQFSILRADFFTHAIQKRATLPASLVEKMGACIGDVTVQTAHIQAFANSNALSATWMALIPNMLSYSSLPSELSYTLSRHYHFALSEPEDKMSQKYKFWHWANLYNGSLHEIIPEQRVSRVELTWKAEGLQLEILWINSLHTPTTRRITVLLPFTRQYLTEHPAQAELLPLLIDKFSTDNPRNVNLPDKVPSEFLSHCEKLRTELRLAILLQTKPCIEYDDANRVFRIEKCPNQDVESGYQVLMEEYEGLFQDLLSKPSTPKAFTTRVWTGHALVRYDLDYEVTRREETYLGTEDGNEHDETGNFTTITLRFSQMPDIAYTSTYEKPPTPLVLALQLALLKEKYYQRSTSS